MKRLAIVAATLAAVAVVVTVALRGGDRVEAQPGHPAIFFGTITVKGAPPALGTVVRARFGDKICGQTQVHDIPGVGIAYNLRVEWWAPFGGSEPDCPYYGDVVVFEWVGPEGQVIACSPKGIWDDIHGFKRLNLTCPARAQVVLLTGENLVEWQATACKPSEEAFQQLANEGALKVAWKLIAPLQIWWGFDPNAPASLNSFGAICPGDILIAHVSKDIVWEQDIQAAVTALAGADSPNLEVTQGILPSVFYGKITVDGATPAEDSWVRALIGGKICARGQVRDLGSPLGVGYYVEVMHMGKEPGCGERGATVQFEWVDYDRQYEIVIRDIPRIIIPCRPEGIWDNTGGFIRLDLTCPLAGAKAVLFKGENLAAWQPTVCKPAAEAFGQLTEEGALIVAWKLIAPLQTWWGFDPDAPTEVNKLRRVCPGDILLMYTAKDTVWQQGP